MNAYLLAAAIVAIVVGAIHSVLGEVLIFRHLRKGALVPTASAPPLRERDVRILWASWHIATVFGWAFAVLLLQLATVEQAAIGAFIGSSLLVLLGTRCRHPGWIGLLAVAALALAGATASLFLVPLASILGAFLATGAVMLMARRGASPGPVARPRGGRGRQGDRDRRCAGASDRCALVSQALRSAKASFLDLSRLQRLGSRNEQGQVRRNASGAPEGFG